MNNLLTIIIPVYNGEKTIHRCLQSIYLQTYKNLEILIVDDGSTDHTKEACMNFIHMDHRFLYIYQENRGVSAARNTGLKKAKGDYIEFVDADDCIDPTFCYQLLSTLIQEKSDLCLAPVQVHKNDDVLRTVQIDKKIYEIDDPNTYISIRKLNLGVCNKIYVKRHIHSLFNEESSLGEDTLFVLEYLKAIKYISYQDQALYHVFLDNEESLNRKYRRNKLLELLHIRYCEFQWNIEKYNDKLDKKYFSNMILSTYIYGVLSLLKEHSLREIQDIIRVCNDNVLRSVMKSNKNVIRFRYIIIYYLIQFKASCLLRIICKIRGI